MTKHKIKIGDVVKASDVPFGAFAEDAECGCRVRRVRQDHPRLLKDFAYNAEELSHYSHFQMTKPAEKCLAEYRSNHYGNPRATGAHNAPLRSIRWSFDNFKIVDLKKAEKPLDFGAFCRKLELLAPELETLLRETKESREMLQNLMRRRVLEFPDELDDLAEIARKHHPLFGDSSFLSMTLHFADRYGKAAAREDVPLYTLDELRDFCAVEVYGYRPKSLRIVQLLDLPEDIQKKAVEFSRNRKHARRLRVLLDNYPQIRFRLRHCFYQFRNVKKTPPASGNAK
jgi:hypothetical protein